MEHVNLWWWLGGELALKFHPAGWHHLAATKVFSRNPEPQGRKRLFFLPHYFNDDDDDNNINNF